MRYQEFPLTVRDNHQLIGTLELKLPLWSRYETAAATTTAYSGFVEAKKTLEKSKKLYQDFVLSFRLGRLSSNDLITEQNRLIASESSLIESELSFHQTMVELCSLAGLSINKCLR